MKNSTKENVHRFFIPSVDDLIWYEPDYCNYDVLNNKGLYLQDDTYYRHVEAATIRTSWDDDALFVGIKGGWGEANHAHADCGTFVLDAKGERWVWDLHSDKYEFPGYFDTFGKRYDYYRNMPSGHNTLIFGSAAHNCQDIYKNARITTFESNSEFANGTIDLTEVYGKYTKKLIRTFSMDKSKEIFSIKDEVVSKGIADFMWQIHTKSDIEIKDAKTAVFYTNNKSITIKLNTDHDTKFQIGSAAPVEGSIFREEQNQNEEYNRLFVMFEDLYSIDYSVDFLIQDTI